MSCISSPIAVVVITGFSGAPRACTHWALSSEEKCSTFACFGHRLIAVIEFFPILGGIVALIDLLFSGIMCSDSDAKVTQDGDLSADEGVIRQQNTPPESSNPPSSSGLTRSRISGVVDNDERIPKEGAVGQLIEGVNAVQKGKIRVLETEGSVTVTGVMDLGSSSEE